MRVGHFFVLLASLFVITPAVASAQLACPGVTPPAGGFPVVFVLNGNAFGPVRADGLAAQFASAARSTNKVCTYVLSHSSMTGQAVFESQIIGPMNALATGAQATSHIINPRRFGIAGFSAGGILSLTALFRYSQTTNFTLKGGITYYGADINMLYDFHTLRGSGAPIFGNQLFAAEKGSGAICNTASGPTNCGYFSRQILSVLNTNMGGVTPAKLRYFSPLGALADVPISAGVPSIYGCFGTADDNVVGGLSAHYTQLESDLYGAQSRISMYNGGHGAAWTACPDSISWLTTVL
ncbi:MAG: hypothetical protein U0136_13950 [Bdellovibrionota bacterium]